ncbi:MAG TPA: sigma-70 family RNA polymerase sigma factor, partial [Terriglobia bacterium]|nr:sigma-70 family RNA polymerase sigma factor [Terriglobia bacterium]
EPAWSESEFSSVFRNHYARVVGVLCRIVGDRTQAEELANEVFWRLYRQTPDPDGRVGGWLYRTATHLGIDSLRASARRDRYERDAGKVLFGDRSAHDPLEEALRAERCRHVRAVLASLKPAHSRILLLRASGFSYEELAGILGVKRGSVGTMLIRAEAEFRKRYLRRKG